MVIKVKNRKFISKIASLLSFSTFLPSSTYGKLKTQSQRVSVSNNTKNKTTKFIKNHKALTCAAASIASIAGYACFLKIYRSFRYHELLPEVNDEMLKSEFQIHFIDVGAGDCAVIKYGNKSWLVDAGYCLSRGITDVTNYLPEVNIKKLNGVILTHAHNDHYWNLKYIFKKFDPEKFYHSYDHGIKAPIDRIEKIQYESRLTEPIKNFKQSKGDQSCVQVKAGDTIVKDGDLKIQVIGPTKEYQKENDNSIVLLIQYKNQKILMMGDAGVESEKDIMKFCSDKNIDISNCDLVKIGHHGSNTSSSSEFVNLTNPNTIVNSTGRNDFTLGLINLHEYPSIIRRWINGNNRSKDKKCEALTTEEQKNIIVYYDGNNKELKYARKKQVS